MNRSSHFARSVVASFTSVGIVCMGGCSAFQPKTQEVTIDSYPRGAMIRVDGKDLGPAPVSVFLQRNQDHSIFAELNGQAVSRKINAKVSTTGVLDIIGTVLFLVPAIGIATPGFWQLNDLHPTLILQNTSGGQPANAPVTTYAPAPAPAPAPRPPTPAAVKPAPAKPAQPPAPVAKAKQDSSDPRFKPAPRIKVYDD